MGCAESKAKKTDDVKPGLEENGKFTNEQPPQIWVLRNEIWVLTDERPNLGPEIDEQECDHDSETKASGREDISSQREQLRMPSRQFRHHYDENPMRTDERHNDSEANVSRHEDVPNQREQVGMAGLQFRHRCECTPMGTHIRVVGSCRSLGCWRPEASITTLGTSAADFPIWRSNVLELGVDEVGLIEYKYVICSGEGDAVRWEDSDNRVLMPSVFKPCCIVIVSETFNACDTMDDQRFLYRFSSKTKVCHPSLTKMFLTESEVTYFPDDSDFILPTQRSASLSCQSGAGSRGAFGLSRRGSTRSDVSVVQGSVQHAKEVPPAPSEVPVEAGEVCMVREESVSHFFLTEHDCKAAEFVQKYRLKGKAPLGEGSFGLVWVCSQRIGSVEERAAKIIHKSRLRPREAHLLLGEDGEIQTHLRLRHQHIVALYEAFDDLDTVTLVMEYCRGGDLFDAVTSTPKVKGSGISEGDASSAQRHILLALAYLDSEHIAHRDIKCENILLLYEKVQISQNVLKLCDFGFATYDNGSGLTDRLGSPDTVAPEVIKGLPYGTRADVWSAGVVLFMMLSARSPFSAPTDAQVLTRIKNAEWSMTGEAWNAVSESAQACVRAMMTAEPSQRPTAQEMLDQDMWLSGH